MEGQTPDQGSSATKKGGPFDNLSRDELIKKCKGLLGIAQKAKQVKDELAEENKNLMEELSKYETQKSADKDCLKVMQEMVNSLTENKLEAATKLNEMEKLISSLQIQQQQNLVKIEEFSIENEALKRQLARQTDENDELLGEISNLERKLEEVNKIGVEQQKHLLVLKESTTKSGQMEEAVNNLKQNIIEINELNNNLNEEKTKLHLMLGEAQNKVDELMNDNKHMVEEINLISNENSKLLADLDSTKQQLDEKLKQCEELSSEKEDSIKLENLQKENSKLIEKLKLYKNKIIDISTKFKQLTSSYKIVLNVVNDYSITIPKWQQEIIKVSQTFKESMSSHEGERKNLMERIATLETEVNLQNSSDNIVNKLNCELIESKRSEQTLNEEIISLKSSIEQLNLELQEKIHDVEIYRDFEDKYKEVVADHEKLLFEIEQQNGIIRHYQSTEKENNEHMEEKLNELHNTIDLKTKQLEDVLKKNKEISNSLENLNGKVVSLKKENSDLLTEMKEINEILKERGEVISKQQSELSRLECQIQELNAEINKKDETVQGFKVEMEKLNNLRQENEKTIKYLTEDAANKKEKLNTTCDAQSEVMSTSTISRFEETARMRDIEDSFEEKYNKLRTLAMKLKKKVAEQTVVINKLESEKNDKTVQALQLDNDKLRDEVEHLRQQPAKEQNDVTSKSLNDEVKLELLNKISIYESELAILKKDKEAFNIAKRDLQKDADQLKNDLINKDKEIKDLLENEKSLKIELDKLKATAKKTNVLSLEMDDYEKSLNDITQKLEAKKIQMQELEETIDSQANSMKSLNNQIRLLEENLVCEKTHSGELKLQIDIQQNKLKESEYEKTELSFKYEQTCKELDNIKLEMDELQLQLLQNASDKDKLFGILQTEKDKLTRQVYSLEDELVTLRTKLKTKEQEFEDVTTEFASYKVRAQSVLRKNQNKDTSREKELEDEVIAMQNTIDTITIQLKAVREQCDDLMKINQELQDDKVRSQNRCKELIGLLDETRVANETILDENKKQNSEHQEALKAQRLHIETLNSCYKKQIEESEEKHNKEMINLKHKYENSNNRNRESQPSTSNGREEKIRTLSYGAATTDEQKIDLILMEREEGEGSENTYPQSSHPPLRKTSSTRSRRELIPLEELLNSSFDETTTEIERNISPTVELQITKDKLNANESRVKHLTALLAEAEQDLAKLTQLNDVLKEEVRRQQRSLERESHMHNSEYLKNVIFKFLTLSSGDEKSHLVPVLNTILKLSPDETQKLQLVARGGGDGANRSWGSYLPIWSNHN